MAFDLREHCSQVRRILVVKLSSLGDIILITPCLRALRRMFPAAEIHLAVESRWRDAVRGNPNLTSTIECSSQVDLSPRYLMDVYRRLATVGPFDLALDFQGTRRSAAWVYLSRARIQAGRGQTRPGWKATARTDHSRHAVLVCVDFCRSIGIPVTDLNPELHLDPNDDRALDRSLDTAGLPGAGFVVLSPFSRWTTKDWPASRAAEFAERVSRNLKTHVVVSGSGNEAERALSVVRRAGCGNVVSLAGQLTLGQAFCLFRRARVMVSCDSGPMHAAAALGSPVVALFGPTHPEHTGPWGECHRVVQASRPEHHHAYRSNDAMQHMAAIDPEGVLSTVKEMMVAKAAVAT